MKLVREIYGNRKTVLKYVKLEQEEKWDSKRNEKIRLSWWSKIICDSWKFMEVIAAIYSQRPVA